MRSWVRVGGDLLVIVCGAAIIVLATIGGLRPQLAIWVVVVAGLALGVVILVVDLEIQQARDDIRGDIERALRQIRREMDDR